MTYLPRDDHEHTTGYLLPDKSLFLINSSDPWYKDILIYLQTQNYRPQKSKDERQHIRHQGHHYLIVGDTLYYRGVDMILWRCFTHE